MTVIAATRGRFSAVLALGAVGITALGILFSLTLQTPEVAIAVPIVMGLAVAMYALPLRTGALSLFFIVLALEGFQYRLGTGGVWAVPGLHEIGRLLMLNVSTQMGGGPIRAPILDIATLMLFAISMTRSPADLWGARQPTVRAMHMLLWTSAGAATVLVLIGVVQGGSFDDGLWQVRHTLLFPVRAVLLMRALDCNNAELKLIGKLIVGAALLKAVVGLYFLYFIAPGTGIEMEYTTSHTDTLLFVPALAMYVAQCLESRKPRLIVTGFFWVPIVFWGLVANDRRISYVSFALGALVMLVLAPPTPVKKFWARALMFATPLIPFYVIAGWNSDGKGAFFPVGILKSLIVGEKRYEGAVDYRDLENLDLLATWSNHKLIPLGFGHKFEQLFKLPNLGSWFATWEYHPHNSYLWFMTIGGPIGATLMLLPHVATLFLAARAYRESRDFVQRVALLTAIATVIAFFNQVWGDMGTIAWTPSWAAALAAAVAAKLAMKTGAWPAVLRVKREGEF